jgi:hypothetical protein
MFKWFSFLISLVLMLCLAGSALAVDVFWDNNEGTGDRLWTTATNWTPKEPNGSDYAIIDDYVDDGNGPIILSGDIIEVDYLDTGSVNPPPEGVESVLTMTGGSLTVHGWMDIGSYAVGGDYRWDLSGGNVTITGFGDGTWEGLYVGWTSDSAVMNMSDGDVNVFGGFWIGQENTGSADFNMTGGTATFTGWIYVGEADSALGGSGVMNLRGGTIHSGNFSMGAPSHLNLSGGVLTCDADLTVENGWMFDPKEDTAGDTPYSGTLPTLVARGNVTAYDVNDGDIITDSVSYPNEAGLRALVNIDYDVTNAGMTTVSAVAQDPNLAYKPNPFDKAKNVQPAEFSLISWSAGTNAAQHDVYFGTDETAVANADTSSDEYKGRQALATNTYTPDSNHPYVFARDYFWRIDEVDGGGVVQWPGSVWSFTADDHAVVEDFDSYANETQLYVVWDDWSANQTGSEIYVEVDVNFVRDGNTLMYKYDSTDKTGGTCVGSIIDTDTTRLGIGSDWTISGIEALVLYFLGDADNNPNSTSQLYLQLEDTSSNSGVVLYDDMNDVAEASWHKWNIDLAIFDACGVSLANIDQIHIGFGGEIAGGDCSTKTGGTGTVWFDDIELWAPYCRTELIATDFTGDCVTDSLDLAVMAADWLESDGLVVAAPPADAPQVWYRFDEGVGGTINNDGNLGSSHDGIFPGAPNNPTWDSDGAPAVDACDPNYSLNFDGTDFIEIPALNFNSNTVTITTWIKRNGTQDSWAGIVTSREGTSPESLNFGDDHELRYTWNDNTTWWFNSELTVPDGEWTFAALVVEPTKATIYKSDGTTYSSKTNKEPHDVQTFNGITCVGQDRDANNPPRFVTGRIDDVRIYNRSLSEGEVVGLAGLSTTFYEQLETVANLVVRVPDPAVDPNYYPSNPDIINFADYDVLADKWLEGPTLWP